MTPTRKRKNEVLKRVLKICDEFGLKSLKMDGIEVEFFDRPKTKPIPKAADTPDEGLAPKKVQMPPIDMLYWSTEDHIEPEDSETTGNPI